MSHHAFCGLSAEHLGALAVELASRWEARCESKIDAEGIVEQFHQRPGVKAEVEEE